MSIKNASDIEYDDHLWKDLGRLLELAVEEPEDVAEGSAPLKVLAIEVVSLRRDLTGKFVQGGSSRCLLRQYSNRIALARIGHARRSGRKSTT